MADKSKKKQSSKDPAKAVANTMANRERRMARADRERAKNAAKRPNGESHE